MKHPLTRINTGAIPPEGITVNGEITAAELDLVEDDRTEFPLPILFSLHLSLVSGDLLARGRVETEARCRCDRCLAYFNTRIELENLCYLMTVKANDTIDLTESIREDILLFFPQQLICRQKCRGLCANCGQNLNVRKCDCTNNPEVTSIWSELNNLNLDEK